MLISTLNLRGHYIGGELSGWNGQDDEKMAGLQFAAKLHELTINASLAAMVFSYIRHELALGGGLPFGALFASFSFRDISFIWSPEFLGAACAKYPNRRKRWVVILGVLLTAHIAVSVGPSSATIIRPRLDDWPAGGTAFWVNATHDELWPGYVRGSQVSPTCQFDLGDDSCPHSGWEVFGHEYLTIWKNLKPNGVISEATQIPGQNTLRTLYTRARSSTSPDQQLLYNRGFTCATTQTTVIADAIAEIGRLWAVAAANVPGPWRFKYRNYSIYHVDAYQPFVHSRCVRMNASDYWDESSMLSFYNLAAADEYNKDGEYPWISWDNVTATKIVVQAANSSLVPLLFWTSLPPVEFGNASVGAVVTVPSEPGLRETRLYMCTIDARIAPVTIESTPDVIKIVSKPVLNDNTINDAATWPQLSIDPEWADLLNPTDTTTNSTVIQNLIQMTGMWNSTVRIQDYYAPYAVESILAVMIVNGLARAKYGTGVIGTLKGSPEGISGGPHCGDWCEQMMPSNKQTMGDGGMVYDVDAEQQKAASIFTMRATANGYAYSSKGPAAMISIVVLLTYSFSATLHFIYSILSKESSNSWDSMSEIAALALNSEKPKSLQNTGAGIETAGIFEKRVRVIAKGDRLEMAFDPVPECERVEKNVYYG